MNLDELHRTASDDVIALNPHLFGDKPKPPKRIAIRKTWRDEDEFTRQVFAHLGMMEVEWPELALAYHVPNENAHKRPGVRAGIPDICIPLPRGDYAGLYIELKVAGGRVRPSQTDAMAGLQAEGYRVELVTDDLDQALAIVREYMRQPRPTFFQTVLGTP